MNTLLLATGGLSLFRHELLANHPLTEVAGWTLVHFLWQGLLLAALTAVLLAGFRYRSAAARYIVACCGMVAMALVPLATATWLTMGLEAARPAQIAGRNNRPAMDSAQRPVPLALLNQPSAIAIDGGPTGTEAVAAIPETAASGESAAAGPVWRETLRRSFPFFVAFWSAGVFLLSLRLLGGLWRVRQWRRRGVAVEEAGLKQMAARLAARMGLKQRFDLLESAQAAVPAVIGWLKPAVIVPASLVSGLTPAELESLLAHELAHIRRHDYLVNLLQTVVETVLFYHPAVWWLSGIVRAERENCCDDLAVAACGNRMTFARALARMEELRCGAPGLALSARGGSLLGRVQRLVLPSASRPAVWWPAGLAALASVATVASGIWMAALPDDRSALVAPEAGAAVVDPSSPVEPDDDDDFATHQPEIQVVDPVTGQTHHVLAGVKLAHGEQANVRLDMKYSNLMPYTFIPARVAKELGAVDLGEIDFGDAAPPRVEPQQLALPLSSLVPQPPGGQPAAGVVAQEQKPAEEKFVFVDDLDGPAGERKIVPCQADPIWVPDHLAFYGVNQTHQTKFRVVRIDRVDLGLGPRFGPVNALVLDDANTSLGVLGSNWARIPRGPNGETFVHAAVDGFWFMALPQELKPAADDDKVFIIWRLKHVSADEMERVVREKLDIPAPPGNGEPPDPSSPGLVADARTNSLVAQATQEQIDTITELVRETDVPHDAGLAGNGGPETVLAEHDYNMARRESTGWVEVDGVSLPVDDGPEAAGVKVHVTMMMDVVAVEVASGKVLWHHDWNKQDPVWQKATILETGPADGEQKQVVVEFETADGRTRKRFDLRTGADVAEPQPSEAQPAGIRVVQRDGDRITRVEMESLRTGRSPVELLPRHADVLTRQGMPVQGAWVTDRETLVSAHDPSMLPVQPKDLFAAFDAMEVHFNLPEGSGMRAVFTGENIEIATAEFRTTVVVTNGRVKLFDSNGVERADASPDGGAEQLVVDVRSVNGEGVLRMQARGVKPNPGSSPPVQVKCNLATGEPADEEQPPHGAVRYAFENSTADEPARMKICWHYDLQQLAEEAERATGQKWDELLKNDGELPVQTSAGEQHDGSQPLSPPAEVPFQTLELPEAAEGPEFYSIRVDGITHQISRDSLESLLRASELGPIEASIVAEVRRLQREGQFHLSGETDSGLAGADQEWGAVAEHTGRQSRLICQTKQPTVGQPLLFSLELRNTGEKPMRFDPQDYAPFRVLRAHNGDGKAALFIGSTPQTSATPVTLQPGESTLLWDSIDVADLFLLTDGRYEFFAEGGEWATQPIWRDSNTIAVELQPGPLPPLKALVRSLAELETLPEDWRVSMRFEEISLIHSPSNLKRDIAEIRLTFRKEMGPEKFLSEWQRAADPENTFEFTHICPSELGHLYVAAPLKVRKLWPEHVRDIRIAAARALNLNATPAGEDHTGGNVSEPIDEEAAAKPWQATGRITDRDGQPLAGVSVQAHCGFGTLFRSGQAVTDGDGRYDLRFGPGIRSENRQLVQAATISVSLAGHVEQNLHRHGDLVAALEKPEGDDLGWGDMTIEDLFLPGEPKTIDFVMVPATRLSGVVIGKDGDRLDGVRISLTGPDLPPSSSVVAQTRTEKGGRFELNDLPTGFAYQLLIEPAKAEAPWLGWASPFLTLGRDEHGHNCFLTERDGREQYWTIQELYIQLGGDGVNWKEALASAASQPVAIQVDGISTADGSQIRAGIATMMVGTRSE